MEWITKKKDEEGRTNNSLLVYVILILLIASISLAVAGFFFKKKDTSQSEQRQVTKAVQSQDESVSQYFEDSSASFDANEEGAQFLREDPFREMCAPTAGDDLPSVNSNTVCVR